MRNPQSLLIVSSLCIAMVATTGCRFPSNVLAQGGSHTTAAFVSAPAEYNPYFEARKPRKCGSVTHPPNAAEAAALVQCRYDDESETHTYLVQNAKVTSISSLRSFNYALDGSDDNIDATGKVFDMLGTYTVAQCDGVNAYMQNSGKNCRYTDATSAKGGCWRTSFGYWGCSLSSTHSGSGREGLPGPRTFDEVH